VRGIERIGGFGGKADVLAECAVFTGKPDCYKRRRCARRDAHRGAAQGGRQEVAVEGRLTRSSSCRAPASHRRSAGGHRRRADDGGAPAKGLKTIAERRRSHQGRADHGHVPGAGVPGARARDPGQRPEGGAGASPRPAGGAAEPRGADAGFTSDPRASRAPRRSRWACSTRAPAATARWRSVIAPIRSARGSAPARQFDQAHAVPVGADQEPRAVARPPGRHAPAPDLRRRRDRARAHHLARRAQAREGAAGLAGARAIYPRCSTAPATRTRPRPAAPAPRPASARSPSAELKCSGSRAPAARIARR
jgi:hypothetical protein